VFLLRTRFQLVSCLLQSWPNDGGSFLMISNKSKVASKQDYDFEEKSSLLLITIFNLPPEMAEVV
jgi:hypothetical protein